MNHFRVPSAESFRLSDYDPGDTHGTPKEAAERLLSENRRRIAQLQNVLYAEKKKSLLVVLQSMDTAGKDPIIRDVLDQVNSQAARVTHFKKAEGEEEERHDEFWRFHKAMPPDRREREYKRFRLFEELLSESGISVIKIYLHISKEEQKRRLQERIDNPNRHWELSESDFKERQYWEGYMLAYESLIRATHRDYAPWYLIPSDNKTFRDAAASVIFLEALQRLDPQYPPAKIDLNHIEWY